MKKLIAITFIVIHLFNIGGALAVHQYCVYKSDKFFAAQTAKDRYNIHDLTEVKIPVQMPGAVDWPEYVQTTGRVEFQDNSYNYVKMRITKDAIYLMCVPNYSTTRLSKENIISAKHIKDIPVPKKDHVPFGKMKVHDNFKFSFIQFAFDTVVENLKVVIIQPVQSVPTHSPDIPEQPPKFFC